jgi:16S rRNA processing protein RimM
MIQKDNLIKIGVLAKPHGVAGEVLIRLIPELAGTEPEPTWAFVDVQGGLVPFEVFSSRLKSDEALLLTLDTLTSDDKARRFQGADVYIDPLELGAAEEEDLTINALIGYQVVDKVHGPLGIITAIHDIKQNPLAEIEYKGREVLIPLQDDFIISMDKGSRHLFIQTPEGLIELFLE